MRLPSWFVASTLALIPVLPVRSVQTDVGSRGMGKKSAGGPDRSFSLYADRESDESAFGEEVPSRVHPQPRQKKKRVGLLRSRVGIVPGYSLDSGDASTSGPVQVPLRRTNNDWYAADLTFGGDQSFAVVVDTGSSNLWVPGESVHTMGGAESYRPSRTYSAAPGDGTFAVTYGRGRTEGKLGRDRIEAKTSSGGDAFGPTQCQFGVTTSESSFWAGQSTDGVWGLGLAPPNMGGPTLTECLETDGRIKSRVFAMELGESGGTLTVGSLPEAYKDRLRFMPTQTSDCWQVPLGSVTVKGGGQGGNKEAVNLGIGALLDTGSRGIILPVGSAVELAQAMGIDNPSAEKRRDEVSDTKLTRFKVPCEKKDSLPTLSLSLGEGDEGVTVDLAPADYLGTCRTRDGEGCQCNTFVEGWHQDRAVLGNVFLRRVVSVFDSDKQQVGLVAKNGAEGSSTEPGASPGPGSAAPPATGGAGAESASPDAATPAGSANPTVPFSSLVAPERSPVVASEKQESPAAVGSSADSAVKPDESWMGSTLHDSSSYLDPLSTPSLAVTPQRSPAAVAPVDYSPVQPAADQSWMAVLPGRNGDLSSSSPTPSMDQEPSSPTSPQRSPPTSAGDSTTSEDKDGWMAVIPRKADPSSPTPFKVPGWVSGVW